MKTLLVPLFLLTLFARAAEPIRWHETETETTPSALTYGNGIWWSMIDGAHTSLDGLRWIKRSESHWSVKPHFLHGEFYYLGNTIYASPNGWLNMRPVGSPFGGGMVHGITFGNEQFYAVNSQQISMSPDGTNWIRSALPELQGTLKLIAAGSGAVVLVTTKGFVYSSQDGHTWASLDLGFSLADLKATADGFLAVRYFYKPSGSFASRLHHSSNGVDWRVVQEKPGSADRICVGPDKVAVWGQGILGLVSHNGSDWVDVTRPSEKIIRDLTYGGGRFLGVMWPSGMISSTPFAPPRIEYISKNGGTVSLGTKVTEGYILERTEELGTAWVRARVTVMTDRGVQLDEPAGTNVFYRLRWREP